MRKMLTIALPVAVAVAVSTFVPVKTAQAYPAICDSTYRSCMADANSFDLIVQCIVAFRECSGSDTPPPLNPVRGVIKPD